MKGSAVTPAAAGQGNAAVGRRQGLSSKESFFHRILTEQEDRIRFSSHAAARIEKRGVQLTSEDIRRLGDAVDRMQEKGVKDALVYMNNSIALVVSVQNRTVITAVDEASAKENIFTNIDSAAIL